jgi:hypothetical protein
MIPIPGPDSQSLDPLLVVADGQLCRLRVWSEEEWSAVPADRRPRRVAHLPGLGWVGAVAIREWNGLSPAARALDRRRADRRRIDSGDGTGRRRQERRGPDRRRLDRRVATGPAGAVGEPMRTDGEARRVVPV